MSNCIERLTALAPLLDRVVPNPNATIGFEWMSGGLSWSDETPVHQIVEQLPDGSLQGLRPVLRYRSSLIEGKPQENFRIYWEKAIELFPHWPGFLPERSDPKWLPLLQELATKANDDWEALDERYRAQQAKKHARAAVPAPERSRQEMP